MIKLSEKWWAVTVHRGCGMASIHRLSLGSATANRRSLWRFAGCAFSESVLGCLFVHELRGKCKLSRLSRLNNRSSIAEPRRGFRMIAKRFSKCAECGRYGSMSDNDETFWICRIGLIRDISHRIALSMRKIHPQNARTQPLSSQWLAIPARKSDRPHL
jgi:hypothetical protein